MGEIITLDADQPKGVKRPGMMAAAVVGEDKQKQKLTREDLYCPLPLDVMGSKMYLKFIGTTEAQVWSLLCSSIRRGPSASGGLGTAYYKKYYLGQKKLVSRWDQKVIAEKIGLSKNSVGCVSRAIKRLVEDWQFIFIHNEQSGMKTRKLYELGSWEIVPGKNKRVETLYLVERIRKLDADLPIKKAGKVYTDEELAASDRAPIFGDSTGFVDDEKAEQRG